MSVVWLPLLGLFGFFGDLESIHVPHLVVKFDQILNEEEKIFQTLKLTGLTAATLTGGRYRDSNFVATTVFVAAKCSSAMTECTFGTANTNFAVTTCLDPWVS